MVAPPVAPVCEPIIKDGAVTAMEPFVNVIVLFLQALRSTPSFEVAVAAAFASVTSARSVPAVVLPTSLSLHDVTVNVAALADPATPANMNALAIHVLSHFFAGARPE